MKKNVNHEEKTIGIGIYEDEYCTNYVGDMSEMEKVTGQSYSDDYLRPYYPKQCISCMAKVRVVLCDGVLLCRLIGNVVRSLG